MKIQFNNEALKLLRTQNKLNIVQLTKSVGFSSGHIARLESGDYKLPNIDIVYRLAFYFNVPMETFCISHSTDVNVLTKMSK